MTGQLTASSIHGEGSAFTVTLPLMTVEQVATGKLPREVVALTREEEAWHTR